MRLLCETVVRDILPAVRSLTAKELKEDGYNQTEIAETLEITQPAVSQYLSAARGKKVQRIEQDEEAYRKVQDLVEMLRDGASDQEVSEELCEVCLQIRQKGLFDEGFEGSEDLDSMCGFKNS